MMTSSTTDQFSVHCSEWLRWIFYSQIRSHYFDTGWVLSHISVVFFWIPFKPQNTLLQWLLHLHVKFQSIPVSGLPCRRDRPLIFLRDKLIITP